ncbi:uncharacterized protein [Asterias amurensis]|uniref:uncharacterized protein n=1 Tax=Asterias amurensis TaxID=7602 RepID=UPI003AB5B4DE
MNINGIIVVVVLGLTDVALGGLRYLDINLDRVGIDTPANSIIFDGGRAPVNFRARITPKNGASNILNRFTSDRYKLVAFLATDQQGSNPTAVTPGVIPSADQLKPLTDGRQLVLPDVDVVFDLTRVDCSSNKFPYACLTLSPADVVANHWQPSTSSVLTRCVYISCKPKPVRVDLDSVDVDIPRDAIIVDGGIVDLSLCVYFTPKNGAAQELNSLGSIAKFKLTAFLSTSSTGVGNTAQVIGTIHKIDQTQVLTDNKQVSFYDAEFPFDLSNIDCTDGAYPYVCVTLSPDDGVSGLWGLTANSVRTVCTPIICLAQDNFQALRVCEDNVFSLSCPAGHAIHVADAVYGRIIPGNTVCPSSSILTTKCRASNSLKVVRDKCEGETACSFTTNNGVFGDPCPGTTKYLHAFYICRDTGIVKTVCDGAWLQIDCPAGKGVNILDANFGRYAGENVCGSAGSDECITENSLAAVHTKCQGKRWCKVPATTAWFSDCCYGGPRYLRVRYKCDYPIMVYKSVCQGGSLGIDCPTGHIIKIDYALYGRVHGSAVCNSQHLLDFNCKAENALSIVKNKCENQRWCSVKATNYVFGNPCKGTHKYLFVRYYCKPH